MKFSKKYTGKKMFSQKFDILINKQATPITKFNDEVMKLPASDEITRIDGIYPTKPSAAFPNLRRLSL
jgi:hypothetical protein